MEEKKRKTGLGIDVFFPTAPGGAEETLPTETAPVEEKPAVAVAVPPQVGKPRPKRASLPKTRRMGTKEEKVPVKEVLESAMVKLTIMTPQEYADFLEELKRRERRRLNQRGEKNYRRKMTITHLVNQAVAEFLAKRGFKVKGV